VIRSATWRRTSIKSALIFGDIPCVRPGRCGGGGGGTAAVSRALLSGQIMARVSAAAVAALALSEMLPLRHTACIVLPNSVL